MEHNGGITGSKFMQTYHCIVTGLEKKNVSVVDCVNLTIVDLKCVGIWWIQGKCRNV